MALASSVCVSVRSSLEEKKHVQKTAVQLVVCVTKQHRGKCLDSSVQELERKLAPVSIAGEAGLSTEILDNKSD